MSELQIQSEHVRSGGQWSGRQQQHGHRAHCPGVVEIFFSFGRISTCLRTVGVGGFFAPSDIQCRDEQCEGGVSAKRGVGGMGGGTWV